MRLLRSPASQRVRLPIYLLLAIQIASVGASFAQTSAGPSAPTVQITGRVLDIALAPLPGAEVAIERVEGTGSGLPLRTLLTNRNGSYLFRSLERGEYRITVSRLGFLSTSIEVDVREVQHFDISVALELAPITLAPVEAHVNVPDPYGATRPVEIAANESWDQYRQDTYLVGDARDLTHSDVIAAVTLAETDVFRALQRVPGVGTRDDYTATMWTRGAAWGQTRVFFDGMPLYNPTHAGWLFAAVNPDAIGAVSFHPGYRSARWGEGAAGVLDLRSRTGGSGDGVRGKSEVSFASARLTADGATPGGGLTWMLAGRRSYVDVFAAMAEGVVGVGDLHIPYDFSDLTGRAQLEVGRGWSLETSALFEYDHLRGDIPGFLEGNRGHWGNRAMRLTASGPAGPFTARITGGGTDFATSIVEREVRLADAPTLPALQNGIRHRSLLVEIEPARAAGAGAWTVGFGIVQDSVRYDGPFSPYVSLVTQHTPTSSPFRFGSSLTHGVLWGERRWDLGGNVSAITGLRFEMGDSLFNGGRLRTAPRLALRAEPTDAVAFSAGWSRSYQYTQDVSPAGGPVGPQLHLSATWVLAGASPHFPVLASDLVSAGVEGKWGDGWSFLGNGYFRYSTGVKIPNPFPGPVTLGRVPDAEATNSATGIELTLRRTSDRWTGSVGVARGRSMMTLQPRLAEDPVLRFPSSADIRNSIDASMLYQATRSVRLGGAFSYGSGVPFTRLLLGDGREGASPGNIVNASTNGSPILGNPNGERTPSYGSLDLVAEYDRSFGRVRATAYLQMRNILDRANAVTYAGSWKCPGAEGLYAMASFDETCQGRSGLTDAYENGLPRLPLIGVRIGF